jgi:2-amino-4-hydroxy-6-hydroxymethyldihydropteridine diphosphokinase
LSLVYIGVGSNISPEENLPIALELLQTRVRVLAISTHYRTAPLAGRLEQSDYINGVWEIETAILYSDLKPLLRDIENSCGRCRSKDRYASRPIDLDILLYDSLEIIGELPDEDIYTRPFIAYPLLEIDPEIHIAGKTQPFIDEISHLSNYLVIDETVTKLLNDIHKLNR